MTEQQAITKAEPKRDQLAAYLQQPAAIKRLNEVAAGFLKPEALIRMALIARTRQPLIARCTRESILRALMDAAQLKIQPGGLNGRGYLVPRRCWNAEKRTAEYECHFDPGYRGLIDIARRSRQIKSISAQVVYENDEFEYGHNPDPYLKHTPVLNGERGEIIAAYAVALLVDDARQIEVVSKADIEKVMNTSSSVQAKERNKNDPKKKDKSAGPWDDWTAEMARKTAARRLCKWLPVVDTELEYAMALSDSADIGKRLVNNDRVEAFDGGELPAGDVHTPRSQELTQQLEAKGEDLDDLEAEVNEFDREAAREAEGEEA